MRNNIKTIEDKMIKKLCDEIRQTAYDIHVYLKSGHLEKVYENALVHRLRKSGLTVEQQYPLAIYDEDGTELGHYFADIFAEQKIIIEVKACSQIANEHISQILGYLKASKIEHGMLINFGSPKIQIKKFIQNEINSL